ncbi:MAG: AbrB/MazE/SpoVT family DNA-binding domain-containing protein [Candidatus Omnitrophica bacterium]|nr:AbrB/MazE/SpoVT family DNA-binding domain-containing protein [Candidatus Omnitrophota bacterium]
MTWFTATLGPKGQITLPKKVRMTIGALEKGDTVGFMVDEKSESVRLAKMEVRPTEAYTEEELQKLLKIAHQKNGKLFASAEGFLRHLDSL